MSADVRDERPIVQKIGVVVVHGVADAEQGYNLKTLVDTLAAQSGGRVKPASHLEVHEFEETSLISNEKSKLPFFLRRAVLDGHQPITFAEAFWADTTRVATGKVTALRAAFRIVFEMHYFINALVLQNTKRWGAWILAVLLHAAALLIRGPVVAVNIVLLSVAAVYFSGQAIAKLAGRSDYTVMTVPQAVFWVCVFVLLVSVYYLLKNAGMRLSRKSWRWRLKKTNQIDLVALEVCVFAALISAVTCIVVVRMQLPDSVTGGKGLVIYGEAVFGKLIWVWKALCAILIAAFVVAGVLALSSSFAGKTRSLWAALALVILQASLWVLFISIPGVLLLGWAKVGDIPIGNIEGVKFDFAMNFGALLGLAIIAIAVIFVRWRIGKNAGCGRQKRSRGAESEKQSARADVLERSARNMPRLIMSPLMIGFILAAGLFSLVAALGNFQYAQLVGTSDWSILIAALTAGLALSLYSALDTREFVNVVHIARDLIDHHYEPKLSFASFLRPRLRRNSPRYPRRKRLLLRVEAALQFLVQDGCDTIVFVAHSQGTVIVFEYFRTLSNNALFEADKTTVVTFGSPLEHLYAHYFQDYATLSTMLVAQKRRFTSWTNLYRIDDPIGNRIDIDNGEKLVVNVAMERGGHTNYWKEPAVAEAILAAIASLKG